MLLLDETFRGASFDQRLAWYNAPPNVVLGDDGLTLETAPKTDFWQRTHYGFRADGGHALLANLRGDFTLETQVTFYPVHQYDQAGLLVRLSAECWLKTSIEFELGQPSRLGSVVTNAGWSDWATEDVPASVRHARYRISRRAGDYLVEHSAGDVGAWRQIRLAHLHDDDGARPIGAGLYACSPKAAGFRATFHGLRIRLGA